MFKKNIVIFFLLILSSNKTNGTIDEAMAAICKLSNTKKNLITKYCVVKIDYYKLVKEYRKELKKNIPDSQDGWKDKFAKLTDLEKKMQAKLDEVNNFDKNLDNNRFYSEQNDQIKNRELARKALQEIDKISCKASDIDKLQAIIQRINP